MMRDEFFDYFREVHYALHRCWTKAVGLPDYDKHDWKMIDNALGEFARDAAEQSGIARTESLLRFRDEKPIAE